MNGRVARKIRQAVKRDWIQYLRDIKDLSFWERVGLAWWIVFGNEKVSF